MALNFVSILLMGRVVFGVSSLLPVLAKRRALEAWCGAKNEACRWTWLSGSASLALLVADSVPACYGEVADQRSRRACLGAGALLSCAGFVFLGLSDAGLTAGVVALGAGGPGVFLGCLGFAQAFPDLEPLLVTSTAAAWDSSALVLVAVARLSQTVDSLALATSAVALAAACAAVASWAALGHFGSHEKPALSEDDVDDLWAALVRPDTVLLNCFMAVFNVKCTLFLETFARELTSWPYSTVVARIFDFAFPLGGLASAIAVAAFLSSKRRNHAAAFGLVVALCNVFCLVQLGGTACQYAAAVLLGPARTAQWAVYLHLLHERYPARVSGRTLGYCSLIITALSDLLPPVISHFFEAISATALAPDCDHPDRVRQNGYFVIHMTLDIFVAAASLACYTHLATHHPPKPQPHSCAHEPTSDSFRSHQSCRATAVARSISSPNLKLHARIAATANTTVRDES